MAITQTRYLKILATFIMGTLLCAGVCTAEARTVRTKKSAKDTGQPALVIVDGAAIYEKSNFDSPVMDYLERGKKVLISRKIYRGAGGLGAFYKIKIRKGVFGYITDVDVQVDKATKERNEIEDRQRKQKQEDEDSDPTRIQPNLENPDADEDSQDQNGELFMTRYLGGGINQMNYAETIAKRKKSSNTTMLAIKMSGPGTALGGMPLDFEFSFTTQAPDFYDQSFSSAKGFLLLGHAMTILPLAQFKTSMFYYGFGLVGKYEKFDVVLKSAPSTPAIDSQELGIGVGGQIGYVYSFGSRYCLRVDGKYYFEKEAYFGYGASLQMKY